jgi:hypothetical protein
MQCVYVINRSSVMLTRLGAALVAAIALSAAAFAQSSSLPQSDFGKDFKPSNPSTTNKSSPSAPATLNTNPYTAQIGASPPPSAYTGTYSSAYGSTYGGTSGAAPGNR